MPITVTAGTNVILILSSLSIRKGTNPKVPKRKSKKQIMNYGKDSTSSYCHPGICGLPVGIQQHTMRGQPQTCRRQSTRQKPRHWRNQEVSCNEPEMLCNTNICLSSKQTTNNDHYPNHNSQVVKRPSVENPRKTTKEIQACR